MRIHRGEEQFVGPKSLSNQMIYSWRYKVSIEVHKLLTESANFIARGLGELKDFYRLESFDKRNGHLKSHFIFNR